MAVVWAFQRMKELGDETGFVDVPDALAEKLIASGHVQDPRVGGNELLPIGSPFPNAPKGTTAASEKLATVSKTTVVKKAKKATKTKPASRGGE